VTNQIWLIYITPLFKPSNKPSPSAVDFDDSSSYNRPNPKHDLQILETAWIPAGETHVVLLVVDLSSLLA
jgi:hypothetical protein